MATDREALLLQLSADVRGLQKSWDRASGIVDEGSRRMERRAGVLVNTLERQLGSVKLPKSLAREYEKLGDEIGRGLARGSQAAQLALGAISAYAIKLAMDAGEIESAFDVAFKGSAKSAREFSDVLADKVGRDAVELRENMTRLQLVLTGTGVAADQAATMVQRLTAVGVDAGSLFNTSDAVALQKIISGLTGEAEPLKAFGVVINDAALKAELLSLGFKGNTQNASEAAKSIARANLIIKGLAVAQGDAARTADSAANKARAMRAEFNQAARALGEQLLPAFVQVAGAATDTLKAFNELPGGVQLAGLAFLALIAAGGPIAGLLTNLGRVIKLARETRTAIAAIGTTGAGAGAAGAAGGAAAGARGLGLMAGGPIAATALIGGGLIASGYNYNKTVSEAQKATDDALAAAIQSARAQLEDLAKSGPAGANRRAKLQGDISKLGAEQARRALVAPGGVADPVTAVAGGFSLSAGQLVPNAGSGGGKKKGKATRLEAAEVFDPEILDILQQLEYWRSVEAKGPLQAPGLQLGDGFVSTDDAMTRIREQTEDARRLTEDAVYYGIRGALEAGFHEGLPGVLAYFRDSLTQAALDGLAEALTKNVSGGIAKLFATMAGLPAFANGTSFAPGGMALVGERGPEMVNLPRGAQVVPNHALGALRGLSVGGAQPAVIDYRMSIDLKGANGDAAIRRIAYEAASQGAAASYQAAVRDIPARMAKRARNTLGRR